MADWNPGDLCQVRRGKRWVDAEVLLVEPVCVRVSFSEYSRLLWVGYADLRPRPAKRGKLPEPTTKLGASDLVVDPRLKADEMFVFSRPVPKPTTARSEAYLAHVRRHPCCSCGREDGIHAHHVASGGMGAKASDYLAAPLCWRCHGEWHSKGMLPTPVYLNRAESLAIMWEAAARCLEEWVVREGER